MSHHEKRDMMIVRNEHGMSYFILSCGHQTSLYTTNCSACYFSTVHCHFFFLFSFILLHQLGFSLSYCFMHVEHMYKGDIFIHTVVIKCENGDSIETWIILFWCRIFKGADSVGTSEKSNCLGFFWPHIKIINNKCFSTWKICISRRYYKFFITKYWEIRGI